MARWRYDTAHPARRCGHAWCSECKTRRGRNLGNRRVRHAIRALLRKTREEASDGRGA